MKMYLNWEPGSAALDAIANIASRGPVPEAGSETARLCAEVLARHLINLLMTASDANVGGRHSAALSLFRNMEDALDCFGAVGLVPGAAERWANGDLKASDAAKLYEPILGEIVLVTGEKATDYRKNLRKYFNHFAHCTPYLTDWDLFPDIQRSRIEAVGRRDSTSCISARLRVNHEQQVLRQNALHIGAYLGAHTMEFSSLVEKAYETFLKGEQALQERLEKSRAKLEGFLKEYGPVFLETPPPQIKSPLIQHPDDPGLVMRLHCAKTGLDSEEA